MANEPTVTLPFAVRDSTMLAVGGVRVNVSVAGFEPAASELLPPDMQVIHHLR